MKALDGVVPTVQLHTQNSSKNWYGLSWVLFVVVILGTWSREQVELLKEANNLILVDDNMLNFVDMDWLFVVHRYVPVIVAFWGYKLWKQSGLSYSQSHGFRLFIASMVQICLGVVHIMFVVPTWTQIAHVVLGSGLLAYVFAVSLSYRKSLN
jgi:heme A synthase